MTEILRAFWKEKRPERIAVLVSGILFAVIFWIYEIPVEIAGYAFLLVILWNVIWFTLVFIRYEKRQRILEENQGKIRILTKVSELYKFVIICYNIKNI